MFTDATKQQPRPRTLHMVSALEARTYHMTVACTHPQCHSCVYFVPRQMTRVPCMKFSTFMKAAWHAVNNVKAGGASGPDGTSRGIFTIAFSSSDPPSVQTALFISWALASQWSNVQYRKFSLTGVFWGLDSLLCMPANDHITTSDT
jgi:hypothetical protein